MIIVQKFGGTSLGRKGGLKKIVSIVSHYLKESRVAVVVSAFSSHTKKEGTTAKLILASQLAVKGKSFSKVLQEIRQNHFQHLNIIQDEKIKKNTFLSVEKTLQSLGDFLKATSIIGELTYKSVDNILSTGEKLSAKIFTAVLEDNGIAAQTVDLSSFIKGNFTEADAKFFSQIEKKLKIYQKETKEKVFVFTGFIGNIPNGILSSLGRGYTDFTACLIASSFQAKELQIWKEVDGVFSADPRLIPKAHLIPSVHPEEAEELTYYGSEVIHPSVTSYMNKKKIPLCIKNTFNIEGAGTIIHSENSHGNSGAVAVTCKKNILMMNIHSNRMLMAYGFMGNLFFIFKKYKIIIDIIATSEVSVSLTLANQKIPKSMLQELNALGKVTIQDKMSIISLIGRGLRKQIGSAGKMFSTLAKGNINIELISQGSSEVNISCVIRSSDANKALKLLHQEIIEK